MSFMKKLYNSLPAESLILIGNFAAVSVVGVAVFAKGLDTMKKEKNFEEVGENHVFLAKSKSFDPFTKATLREKPAYQQLS
ncbi:hypothetical protein PPL_09988 [Heterostelium album PN500]|uniref:Uncharacterized protein n=1 Tax=Heterostelium pallidum (strain ATCC 26659 / Pp 5 / PN500) TaxID=670386 RepID=D3BPU4_HETP5|nr:hypothetical protein PPL_09988 [Heterostelium album PN500]EFA76227.1 hypothetical protein PPL_09988 [Heterostelium album PN500]|eukprot:XP_020428360.1 hypothetical protein PPL_09988 [Heterostelium album PN500]